MVVDAATCTAVLGLDIGEFSRRASLVSKAGETILSESALDTEYDLDALFFQMEGGAVVVVDQIRNTMLVAKAVAYGTLHQRHPQNHHRTTPLHRRLQPVSA